MAENNSTNGYITQIQVSDSEKYDLDATYWSGNLFQDYKIDGQSIYNGGSISIFKKYQQVNGEHPFPNTLTPNTKYIFTTEVESLDFTKVNWNNDGYEYCEYVFIFSSSGVITTEFNFPSDWYWSNGEEPFIEPNMRYELSVSVIKDNNNNNIVHAILVPFVQVKVVANNE